MNPQFDTAFDFDDNDHAPVRSDGKWTFIDRRGIPVGDQAFLEVSGTLSEGLRAARTSEGWGFVQGTKFVIRPLFDSADSFLGGLARVTIGGQEVYVDKTGAYAGDPFKGRAIRPTHAVQEVWEGDVTGPRWTIHEKFLLFREGTRIKGYHSSSNANPSWLSNLWDVLAEVNPDDTVSLVSADGLTWKGRFLAPVVIAGTWPNGKDEFPFRFHLVRDATAADLPAPTPPTSTDWGTFLDRFKEAISQRDQTSIAAMLARNFSLQNARLGSVEDVFRKLNWQQLDKALAEGAMTTQNSFLGRPSHLITDAHPCVDCVYQVTLWFTEDADGQWRWTGIGYPGN